MAVQMSEEDSASLQIRFPKRDKSVENANTQN